jgi:purine catabolism regulator
VLHEIVPFVEITEQVQTALLNRSAAAAGRDRDLRERLSDALLCGAGPAELTAELAAHLGAPVVVTTADGAVAALAGLPSGRARRPRSVCRHEITLLDRHWGRLAVLTPAQVDDPAVHTACALGADAVGLALLRSATADDLAARRRWLIDDLVQGRFRSAEELVSRCRVLGLPFTESGSYVALLIGGVNIDDQPLALRSIENALSPTAALVADQGPDIVAIAATSDPGEHVAAAVLTALDAQRGSASTRVVHSSPVSGLAQVGRSISDTRRAAEVADQLRIRQRSLSASSLTAHILLAELTSRPSAQQLVREELGPLLDQDQRRGTTLVETLRVYLAHGSNKVDTAATLHIRRQTMHQRLARIAALIGDIDDPRRHTNLVLALALTALPDNTTEAITERAPQPTQEHRPRPAPSPSAAGPATLRALPGRT